MGIRAGHGWSGTGKGLVVRSSIYLSDKGDGLGLCVMAEI